MEKQASNDSTDNNNLADKSFTPPTTGGSKPTTQQDGQERRKVVQTVVDKWPLTPLYVKIVDKDSTDVTIANEANKIARSANRIQIGVAILTFTLLLFTIRANRISTKSLEAALAANRISDSALNRTDSALRQTDSVLKQTAEANIIARRSLDEARSSNNLTQENINFSKQEAKSNAEISRLNLELTKQSVQSQLEEISESRKQFEYSHMPFLDIKNIRLKDRTIYYDVQNLGNYPAQIKYIYHNTKCENGERIVRLKSGDYWRYPGHVTQALYRQQRYVLKDVPVTDVPAPWGGDPRARTLQPSFMFTGKIYYENQISKKLRVYCFEIELGWSKSDSLSIVYSNTKNYDYDLKKAPQIGSDAIDPNQ